jgi:hypothetical protein
LPFISHGSAYISYRCHTSKVRSARSSGQAALTPWATIAGSVQRRPQRIDQQPVNIRTIAADLDLNLDRVEDTPELAHR